MPQTKAEVRDRAANDLGVLPLNGDALQSQHVTRIEQAYDEVYEDLKDEGLAIWASTASVPNNIVPHMAALVANNCLGSYAVSESRYVRIKNEASFAKREIRRLTAPDYVSQDEPTDY